MTGGTDKGKGECQTPQARKPFWCESCVGPNRARLRPAPNGATLTRLPVGRDRPQISATVTWKLSARAR